MCHTLLESISALKGFLVASPASHKGIGPVANTTEYGGSQSSSKVLVVYCGPIIAGGRRLHEISLAPVVLKENIC